MVDLTRDEYLFCLSLFPIILNIHTMWGEVVRVTLLPPFTGSRYLRSFTYDTVQTTYSVWMWRQP